MTVMVLLNVATGDDAANLDLCRGLGAANWYPPRIITPITTPIPENTHCRLSHSQPIRPYYINLVRASSVAKIRVRVIWHAAISHRFHLASVCHRINMSRRREN